MTFSSWSGKPEDVLASNGFNVSNANGMTLLRCLEIPTDYSGKIEVDTLRARARRAELEWEPGDEGQPWTESENGRFIDCGRYPGYLNDRIEDVLELCNDAERLGHRYVAWS